MRKLLYFLPIIIIIACSDTQGPGSGTPGKVLIVPKIPDDSAVERGIDAVPDRDGIFLSWYKLQENNLRYYNIYRQRDGETYYRKIKVIDLETAFPGSDTTYTDAPDDIIFYNLCSYYLRAVNSDDVEGTASDTVSYTLWRKPILSRPNGEQVSDLPVFDWSFPDLIPDKYILRIEEDITNRLVFVRKFQVTEYDSEQSLDLNQISDPPEFNTDFQYRWRIDSVGPDSLYSGSESQWFTFIAN